jgi:hypothetical protein
MRRRRLSRPRGTGARRTEASISPGRTTAPWATADRNFERDALDFARMDSTRLSVPVLVLSGEKAGGTFLIERAKLVASDVAPKWSRARVTG